MKIGGIATDTGEQMATEVTGLKQDSVDWLTQLGLTSDQLRAKIETLDISADADEAGKKGH